MAAELKPLTYKEKAFGDFFVSNGFIGWRAAESARYQGSRDTLYVRASENLKKPNVIAYIDSLMDDLIMDVDQALAEMSSIARGEAKYYMNEDGSVDVEGLKESGLIRNLESIETSLRTEGYGDNAEDIVVTKAKFSSRIQALRDILKANDKIKPNKVQVVIGFDEAMLKSYGTEEEKDAYSR